MRRKSSNAAHASPETPPRELAAWRSMVPGRSVARCFPPFSFPSRTRGAHDTECLALNFASARNSPSQIRQGAPLGEREHGAQRNPAATLYVSGKRVEIKLRPAGAWPALRLRLGALRDPGLAAIAAAHSLATALISASLAAFVEGPLKIEN
jgi:hypothetical protein